jgi:hypothetical protein
MREVGARGRARLARVRLVGGVDARLGRWTGARTRNDALAVEFPTVTIELGRTAGSDDAVIDAQRWRLAETFRPFDDSVECSEGDAIAIVGDAGDPEALAREVLTRYQRLLGRRNEASDTRLFDTVLAVHEGLHDPSKPLAMADLAHAVDAWQWMLRLEPRASLAAQLAALLHDVERLESEADRRIEHEAPDYAHFKDAHARRGADRTREVLLAAGVDAATTTSACELVATHERRGRGLEVDLLNDADGLSFFSLNSPGYADYFGPEQTRKKVAYTLARLGSAARRRLGTVRLRADVERLVREHEAAGDREEVA